MAEPKKCPPIFVRVNWDWKEALSDSLTAGQTAAQYVTGVLRPLLEGRWEPVYDGDGRTVIGFQETDDPSPLTLSELERPGGARWLKTRKQKDDRDAGPDTGKRETKTRKPRKRSGRAESVHQDVAPTPRKRATRKQQ